MLDRMALAVVRPPLEKLATGLNKLGVNADQVTWLGFFLGMAALPALALENYWLALIVIGLNRLGDGLDGALARQTHTTDAGAFLDIVLDFIFYSAVVLGFALASPEQNALAATGLIFAFMGTGSSFLAFAILAQKRNIENLSYPNKGFYYLGGIAEGTETILFFMAICIWPQYFPVLAWSFAAICYLTTAMRVIFGYQTLKQIKA